MGTTRGGRSCEMLDLVGRVRREVKAKLVQGSTARHLALLKFNVGIHFLELSHNFLCSTVQGVGIAAVGANEGRGDGVVVCRSQCKQAVVRGGGEDLQGSVS